MKDFSKVMGKVLYDDGSNTGHKRFLIPSKCEYYFSHGIGEPTLIVINHEENEQIRVKLSQLTLSGEAPTDEAAALTTLKEVFKETGKQIIVAPEVAPVSSNTGTVKLFVERNFAGLAGVTITAAGLTSTNDEYNAQLEEAEAGDPTKPYPCLWSAQLAAKTLRDAGYKPLIIVQAGNRYTIGSPTLTQNGNSAGVAATNEEADIKVANVDADQNAISIQPNIAYHFEENTEIVNICKSFTIRFIKISDLAEAACKITVTGRGVFRWVYGQGTGIATQFINLWNCWNADLTFNCHKLMCAQWAAIDINGWQRISMEMDSFYDNANFIAFVHTDDWVTKGKTAPTCYINIKERLRGKDLFPAGLLEPAYGDFWGTQYFNSAYGGYFNINYGRLVINEVYVNAQDGILNRWKNQSSRPLKNNTLIMNIGYFEYRTWTKGAHAGLLTNINYRTDAAVDGTNNHATYNIDQAKSESPFGEGGNSCGMLFGLNNSSITLNVRDFWECDDAFNTCFKIENAGYAATANDNNNQIFIKGKFIQSGGGPDVARGYQATYTNEFTGTEQGFHVQDVSLIQKTAGKPCIDLTNAPSSTNLFLDNVKLINDGVTAPILHNATNAPMRLMLSNVWANSAAALTNLTVEGDALKVNANLNLYVKR